LQGLRPCSTLVPNVPQQALQYRTGGTAVCAAAAVALLQYYGSTQQRRPFESAVTVSDCSQPDALRWQPLASEALAKVLSKPHG